MLRRVQSFIALLCFSCLPLSASNTAVAQSFKTDLVISGLQKPSGINLDVYGNLYYSEIPTPGTGGGANRVCSIEREPQEIGRRFGRRSKPRKHFDGSVWECLLDL